VLDSADIFLDVVSPMLSDYCVSCHNPGKSKGDLVLSSYERIIKGGENGPAVVGGDLVKSELYRRVSLPEHHDDFMPPDGKKSLSGEQIKLLELWIMNGAPDKGQMWNFEMEGDYLSAASKVLGLEENGNNPLGIKVDPADTMLVASLSDRGYVIRAISEGSNLLDVSFLSNGNKESVNIEELLPIKDQIVYLSLGNLNLRDEDLEVIGQFENMVRLNIHSNPITDDGISFLGRLENLEVLNLYGTKIGDNGLERLELLQKLSRIYLWNTQVTPEKVGNLKAKHPDLEINVGEEAS
ncbi:MAG: c-type cytochrome domain-containing protein, partial [Arenibacter troitsensis]|nr:c-type cytochrome domain-containing protein [Arenibacter troitsensis]